MPNGPMNKYQERNSNIVQRGQELSVEAYMTSHFPIHTIAQPFTVYSHKARNSRDE